MNRPLLSNLRFGTLLAYTAHGDSELAQKSIKLRNRIKRCDPRTVSRVGEILIQHLCDRGELVELFERDKLTLVPMPRSAPLPPQKKASGVLWPGLQFCRAMKEAGVECSIEPCLERVVKVQKSAFARPGERPEPDTHFDSMRVTGSKMLVGEHILLVDDFITRGSTMLGAASCLQKEFPNAMIMGFSVVRTVYPQDLKALVEPRVGDITFENGYLNRKP